MMRIAHVGDQSGPLEDVSNTLDTLTGETERSRNLGDSRRRILDHR